MFLPLAGWWFRVFTNYGFGLCHYIGFTRKVDTGFSGAIFFIKHQNFQLKKKLLKKILMVFRIFQH